MKKTLYVSDMDGTLLGADVRISPETSAIITDLTRRGALITVATARTPATVVPLLEGTETAVPAIVMTGAALWRRDAARYANVHYFSAGGVERVLAVCSAHDVCPFVFSLHDDGSLTAYHERPALNAAEQSFYEPRSKLSLKRFRLGRALPSEEAGRVVLFFGLGEHEAIMAAADEISATTDCCVSCYPDTYDRSLRLLEVFAPGVSKASAVRRLRGEVGAERVVVFGDNLNDLAMMRVADVAVAVENALPEVREAADIVIGPNTADAVARFILDDFNSES